MERLKLLYLSTFLILLSAQVGAKISLQDPVTGWAELLNKSGADKYYITQKGDNLYDISASLFGDPHFWPKIWSLNAEITNPHIIEINDVIYFSGGTVLRPPKLGLERLSAETYIYGDELLSPLLPPQVGKTKKAIDLPLSSFPQVFMWEAQTDKDRRKFLNIQFGKKKVKEEQTGYMITSEIVNKLPKRYGIIDKTETGSRNILEGNFVQVSLKSKDHRIGDKFSIFKKVDLRGVSKKKSGVSLIEWKGEITLVEKVKGKKFVAEVSKSHSFLKKGDVLSVEPISKVEMPKVGFDEIDKIHLEKKVKILGGEGKLENDVFLEGAIVYLSKGEKYGVKEGDVYPISSNTGGLFSKKRGVSIYSAMVKVAKVNKYYSTAVLFNVSGHVTSGDGIRPK